MGCQRGDPYQSLKGYGFENGDLRSFFSGSAYQGRNSLPVSKIAFVFKMHGLITEATPVALTRSHDAVPF